MLSRADVDKAHKQLSEIYCRAEILLGGSYCYGEAGEQSDLDFYLWCDFADCVKYARRADLLKPVKEMFPQIKLMVVPELFFKRGWYYIYGKRGDGKIISSKLSKKIVFRNSLKLAFFHYINFLESSSDTQKKTELIKSVQQASVAWILQNSKEKIDSAPLFSLKVIKEHLVKCNFPREPLFREVLDWKGAYGIDAKRLVECGQGVLEVLNDVFRTSGSYLSFSFANYLIYNVRFLWKGSMKFIFVNPDQHLLTEIAGGVNTGENLHELKINMVKEIFPAYIL